MTAADTARAREWLNPAFRDWLDRLEYRHRVVLDRTTADLEAMWGNVR